MRHFIYKLSIILLMLLWHVSISHSQHHELRFELIQTLGRGAVNAIAWSPDGETLAVASSRGLWLYTLDEAYKLQDASLTNGQAIGNDNRNVSRLAWSADGHQLAGVLDGSRIVIWDIESQTQAAILDHHHSPINQLAWSPDNNHLVSSSSSDTGVIWTWNHVTGNWQVQALLGHTQPINQFAWNTDGTWLASASADATVRIWAWDNHTASWESEILAVHSAPVSNIAWHPTHQLLASGSRDGDVQIWAQDRGSNTWQRLQSYQHHDSILALAWSNGDLLASSGYDGRIMLWDSSTNELEQPFALNAYKFDALFWQAATAQLISSGKAVYTWDSAANSQPVEVLDKQSTHFITAPRPDSTQALSVGQNVFYLWDTSTGALLDTQFLHNGIIGSLDWSPDDSNLGGGGGDAWIRAWDVDTGDMTVNFSAHLSPDSPTIAWNPNWTLLAAIHAEDEALVIYDWQQALSLASPTESIPIVARLEEFTGWLVDAAWTSNLGETQFIPVGAFSDHYPLIFDTETWALSGALDGDTNVIEALSIETRPQQASHQVAMGGIYSNNRGFIQVWDVTTHSQVALIQLDTTSIDAIAWNPTGTQLAGLHAGDKRVYIWEMDTQNLRHFELANESFYDLAWSSDDLLAVSSLDKIYSWEMPSLTPPEAISLTQTQQSRVIEIAWSRDGRKLASAHVDGSINIWQAVELTRQ